MLGIIHILGAKNTPTGLGPTRILTANIGQVLEGLGLAWIPTSMQHRDLLGPFLRPWANLLHTVGVQVNLSIFIGSLNLWMII